MAPHHETPTRVRLIDRLGLKANGHLNMKKSEVYKDLQVSDRSARRIVKSGRDRRLQHSNESDGRGIKAKMTSRALRHLEMHIIRHGEDGRQLTWTDLRVELEDFGIKLCERQIANWLGSIGFRRCVACSRSKSHNMKI